MTKEPAGPIAEFPKFEESLDQLDGLIRNMESGELGLAESMAAYEQGVGLLRELHEQLSKVERRVQTLVQIDDNGNPIFAAVEPTTGPATESVNTTTTTSKRGSRRPRSKKTASSHRSRQQLPGMDEPTDNT